MEPESVKSRLTELLDRYEALHAQGQEPSLEDFFREAPELIPALTRKLELLRAWERFEQESTTSALAGAARQAPPSISGDGDSPEAVKTTPPPAPAAFRNWPDLTQPSDSDVNVSREIDRYEIVDKLGEGGMGRVFKARHTVMGKVVAVKVLHRSANTSAEKVRRFRKELLAAGQLEHDNIVRAYDAGCFEGKHFLVMEYIPGVDLATLVRRDGPVPAATAIDYTMQAARALEHAHSLGIVHRDVKPSNLMVTPTGRVKLLDLGLAQVSAFMVTEDSLASSDTGDFKGTVQYASPEQALHDSTIDHRADIYSLGCTLYYLLTGIAPFQGSTSMAILMAHREALVPSVLKKRPDLPAEIDVVLKTMMAKAPNDRYQSMTEVIEALDGVADQCGANPSKPPSIEVNSLLRKEPGSEDVARGVPRASLLHPPRRTWRTRLAVTVLGLLILLAAGVIIKLKFPGVGTLVLEVDQPGAEVLVDGNFVRIMPTDSREPIEITLRPGSYDLLVRRDGFEALTKQFKVSRGDRVNVSVHLERLKIPLPKAVVDIQRETAQWVLGEGGSVRVFEGDLHSFDGDGYGQLDDINYPSRLPNGPFHLISVALPDNRCSEADLARLARCKELRGLFLVNNNIITDAALQHLSGLGELRSLSLDGCPITDAGLLSLGQLNHLDTLKVHRTGVVGTGFSQLSRLPLQEITAGERVTDAGLMAIGRLRYLTKLHVVGETISDQGIGSLSNLKLEVLSVGSPRLTASGIRTIAGFQQLKYLLIGNCKLNDEDLRPICSLPELGHLLLVDISIGKRGLEPLKACPALEALDLVGPGFSNEYLDALPALRKLRFLDLVKTRVSDPGVPALSRLKQLTHLNVTDSQISAKGIADLRRALRQCDVIPRP